MQTSSIRQRLHQYIDSIEDKKVEAIYMLLENEIDTDTLRRKLIQIEREKYIKGEGVSYSWEDIKQMAVDKDKRDGI